MSVLDVAKSIKGLVKISKSSPESDLKTAVIDGFIFQLHYRATAGLLFMFSAIATSFSLVGKPMSCFLPDKEAKVTSKFIDTFCWVEKTFTLPAIEGGPDLRNPYPGIGPDFGLERKYHSYYQWVPLVLFLQAVIFYAPRWFWKNWENKKVQELSKGLRAPCLAADRNEKTLYLANYVRRTLHHHDIYAFCYYFCEFWNFFNVIVNIYLINAFLGGTFMTYGTEVLNFTKVSPGNRTDPMSRIFPLVTKCHFYKYGPTGGIQLLDAVCLLPVNLYYEKIYVFLWFWLSLCAILSATSVIWSMTTATFPAMRVAMLQRKLFHRIPHDVSAFISKLHIGDIFFLNLLSENLDPLVFREILVAIPVRVERSGVKSSKNIPENLKNDCPIIFFPPDAQHLRFQSNHSKLRKNKKVASVRKHPKLLKGKTTLKHVSM